MLLSKTDQKLGLSSSLASCLKDPRDPAKTLHSLEEIIGFRASMIAAGYEDGNDANKLRHDPSFKLALERTPETGAALCSQPTISRMENMANTRSLYRMGHEMARVYCDSFKRTPKKMVLDIDETFDETHGDQQLSLFNSYYGGWGYQPILVFDEEGRLVASLLRPAGRPSGKEAAGLIQRLIHSLRRHWPNTEFLLRADGHYSTPEVMDLCDTLGVDYVFGLPTNSRVRKHVETREADTVKHYKQHYADKETKLRRFQEFFYGARSWGKKTPRHCAHRGRAHGARHALYRDQSDRPSQQVSLRENLLRPWSGRKLHQELETPSRLRSHIMLEGQRQPDAAHDPPLRLLADVDAASRLPETFAVAASPVRHTPLTSDQDRSNYRREENTDRHVAARVMSTSKPDPPPVRSTRTTS